jgi:hypothetical protein
VTIHLERARMLTFGSATNSDSNEDAEPRQPTQLANLDLTESQKARRSQNGKAAEAIAVDGESNERAQTDEMFQVTIGTKSLLKFLSTNVSNSGTIACKSTCLPRHSLGS